MENQELNRYVGDYDKFMEVYEMKKVQLESAYKRQQKEIEELEDFVARNKATKTQLNRIITVGRNGFLLSYNTRTRLDNRNRNSAAFRAKYLSHSNFTS
jgi:ATPase subunit of ABC transporter with duplicated ATPase domains